MRALSNVQDYRAGLRPPWMVWIAATSCDYLSESTPETYL